MVVDIFEGRNQWSLILCVWIIFWKKKQIDIIDELGLQQFYINIVWVRRSAVLFECLSKPKPFTEENEVHAWLIVYILEKRVDLGCVLLLQTTDQYPLILLHSLD